MEDDGEAASANGVGEPAGGLDRLAGLMRVISADVVREALRDPNPGRCTTGWGYRGAGRAGRD